MGCSCEEITTFAAYFFCKDLTFKPFDRLFFSRIRKATVHDNMKSTNTVRSVSAFLVPIFSPFLLLAMWCFTTALLWVLLEVKTSNVTKPVSIAKDLAPSKYCRISLEERWSSEDGETWIQNNSCYCDNVRKFSVFSKVRSGRHLVWQCLICLLFENSIKSTKNLLTYIHSSIRLYWLLLHLSSKSVCLWGAEKHKMQKLYGKQGVQEDLRFTTSENLVQCHCHHVKTNRVMLIPVFFIKVPDACTLHRYLFPTLP